MKIEMKKTEDSLIIKLSGELDESNAKEVREQSDYLIENNNIRKFVYDFKNLRFMDSTGLGVILGRYKKLKASNIMMYITNPNTQVMKVIKTSGISEIINII